jgi:hypothetical protein
MSKQRILMIVALCFVLIGTVAAGIPHEPKPDSVVTCAAVGLPMAVRTHTVPASISIDESECPTGSGVPGSCSICISSLQNQGCEIVDLVTEFIPRDFTNLPDRIMQQTATFQLSCESP